MQTSKDLITYGLREFFLNIAKEYSLQTECSKNVLLAQAAVGGGTVNNALRDYREMMFPWLKEERKKYARNMSKEWADIVSGKIKVVEG